MMKSGASTPNHNTIPPRGGSLEEFRTIKGWNDDRLYPAEKQLLECARTGEICVIAFERPDNADPAVNLIRAGFLRFLSLGGDSEAPLHQRGVAVAGAWITGEATLEAKKGLDFAGCTLPSNLGLWDCTIDGDVILRDCAAMGINLAGSAIGALEGDGLETEGGVFLRDGFTAAGTIRLLGAKIGGDLSCTRATLKGGDVSLHCDGLETEGGVFLRNGFTAAGTVWLAGAKIGGDLSCEAATLNGGDVSLHCDGLETDGNVFLDEGFTAAGTVRLLGAELGGNLSCTAATLNGGDVALFVDGLQTEGDVFLDDGFTAAGTVRLLGAKITGNLDCRGGNFLANERSLDCEATTVTGQGFFDAHTNAGPFHARGTLNFTNSRFEKAVSFQGAVLSCTRLALRAPGLKIADRLAFNGAMIAGPVSITGARIGGDITFDGASIEKGLAFDRSTVEGTFFWRNLDHFAGNLSLGQTRVAALSFDRKSWARPHKIDIDGLTYGRFHQLNASYPATYWIDEFLGPQRRTPGYQPALASTRQREAGSGNGEQKPFRPHAHRRLADVLSAMGYEEEARAVRIDMRRLVVASEKRALGGSGEYGFRRLALQWNRFIGVTVDYGYRPGRAVLWMAAIWLLWTFAVYVPARHAGIMTPANPLIFQQARDGGSLHEACRDNWTEPPCTLPSEYSEFYAPAYSADVLLPIIDFRQQTDWAPRVTRDDGSRDWWGWAVRSAEWIEIALGWLLSLLLVSGVTGMIRRD